MSYQISPTKALPKLSNLDAREVLKHLGSNFTPVAYLSKSRQHNPWLISLSIQFASVCLIITEFNKLTLGSPLRDSLSQFLFHHYLPQSLNFQRTPIRFTILGSIPINFSYQKNMTHILTCLPLNPAMLTSAFPNPFHSCLKTFKDLLSISLRYKRVLNISAYTFRTDGSSFL